MTLSELNAATPENFVAALAAIYEHSPWVAQAALASRPFATIDALHTAMARAVAEAPAATQHAFVAGHPELGGKLARAGTLEAASASEQGGLGLDRLSDDEFTRFDTLNTAYRTRFGFPFVIAVKRHTRATILDAFERRLHHTPEEELRTALAEIHIITRLRLDALLGEE